MEASPSSFFVKTIFDGDKFKSYEVSFNEKFETHQDKSSKEKIDKKTTEENVPFKFVMDDFSKNMEMYLRFIPLMVSVNGIMSLAMMGNRLKKFLTRFGEKREDLSKNKETVYQIPINKLRDFSSDSQEYLAWTSASVYIPQVMLLGLVGVYDHYLSELLSTLFKIKNEIVFGSEKQILFSDLVKYQSIDEVREAIIRKEVETILRESHHDQFRTLETRLGFSLTKDLTVWPKFVELCERRNLFTHTGGVVSQQYLQICRNHKCDIEDISVGTKLTVHPLYLRSSIRIIYEIGVKLLYVMWRKFDHLNRNKADSHFNEVCFNLIVRKEYALAEAILSFASDVTRKTGTDYNHKLITVNLANALRLQEKHEEATAVLDREDWSASEDKFKLCVAAIRKDFDEVIVLIRRIGKDGAISANEYRRWPVFIGIREEERVRLALSDVFGEDIIADDVWQPLEDGLSELRSEQIE
jgi:hypothetical protein